MKNFLVIGILLQLLICNYIEISNGIEGLIGVYVTNGHELSFEKKYQFRELQNSFLVSFAKDESTNKVFVLVFSLHFLFKAKKNGTFDKEQPTKAKLEELFVEEGFLTSNNFFLVEITLIENLYFGFQLPNGFKLYLKLLSNKILLYSNRYLKEVNTDLALYNKIKYGSRAYSQVLLFDGTFILIESKIVYVVFDEDVENIKPIVRRFFVNFKTTWGQVTVMGQSAFLKELPKYKLVKLDSAKTEEPEDKFAAQVDSHELTLAFGYDRMVEENPEIQIKGTDVFGTAVKLMKLNVADLSVAKFLLRNSEVLHVVIPRFILEENWKFTEIIFFLFYDISYTFKGSEKRSTGFGFIFYIFSETEISFALKVTDQRDFSMVLKKNVEKNCLFFEIEVENSSKMESFEISITPDEDRPEFQYVYTGLASPLKQTFNGAVIIDPENIEKQTESDEKEKNDTVPKKVLKCSGKIKKILTVLIILFCLALLIVVVLLTKKICKIICLNNVYNLIKYI